MPGLFAHEVLDVYKVALEVARWVRTTRWPRGDAHLKEGSGPPRRGFRGAEPRGRRIPRKGQRGKHFATAKGSAAEVAACLELSQLPGWEAQIAKLRRAKLMMRNLH